MGIFARFALIVLIVFLVTFFALMQRSRKHMDVLPPESEEMREKERELTRYRIVMSLMATLIFVVVVIIGIMIYQKPQDTHYVPPHERAPAVYSQ